MKRFEYKVVAIPTAFAISMSGDNEFENSGKRRV